jgi:hypothetical protein
MLKNFFGHHQKKKNFFMKRYFATLKRYFTILRHTKRHTKNFSMVFSIFY